jgi:hypothetical protein
VQLAQAPNVYLMIVNLKRRTRMSTLIPTYYLGTCARWDVENRYSGSNSINCNPGLECDGFVLKKSIRHCFCGMV